MTEIFYYGCEFVYAACVVWGVFNLIKCINDIRTTGAREKTIQSAAMIVCAALKVCNVSLNCGIFSNTVMLFVIIIIAAVAWAIYKSRFCDSLLIGSVFWALFSIGDFFMQSLIYVTFFENWAPDCLLMVSIQRGIYLLVWAAFAVGLSHCLVTGAGSVIRAIFRHRIWMWILNITLIVCMVYFQRIYKFNVSGAYYQRWLMFFLGFILLGIVAALYCAMEKERQNSQIQQIKIEMLETNYQQILKERVQRDILVHDMKNHLLMISRLAEMGKDAEISEYIGKMYPVLEQKQKRAVTNHFFLDLILDFKTEQAAEKYILVKLESDDMSGLLLNEMEISALFSNLLDNAIEANERTNAGKGGWIRIRCRRQSRLLVISMSNPVEEDVIDGTLPKTSKKDKNLHGFGMQSIQQIVDAYGGYMDYHVEHKEFQIIISMSAFEV